MDVPEVNFSDQAIYTDFYRINSYLEDTKFMKCPQCNFDLKMKCSKSGIIYITCTMFPKCSYGEYIPKGLESLIMLKDEICENCSK